MLEQRSIVIYRRYNDAYALWEGSDIDIESRLREAAAQLDPNLRLPTDPLDVDATATPSLPAGTSL